MRRNAWARVALSLLLSFAAPCAAQTAWQPSPGHTQVPIWLDPSIMVQPLLWLVSPEADGMTGSRLVATKWQTGGDGKSAAEAATEQAGW